jgi:CheY-like chemotaxis protein
VPPRNASRTIQRQFRVLLVDDDTDCLEVTQAVLHLEGLTVDVAATGADALGKLQSEAYDLLLCDVGMPEMSGWEVAHQARRDRPEMPIYMVTGWAHEIAANDPRRDGVDGVLGKPLELDELRAAVARIAAPAASKTGPATGGAA